MYLLVLYFLFISFFISFFFGKFFNRKLIGYFTSFCVFNSLMISILIFYEVGLNFSICFLDCFKWIQVDLLILNFNFLFDSLTCSMLLIVTFISFLVHLYSIEYMKDDPHQIRFFSYISIFTFFMVVLITSGNLVQLFIGWEGVGIASYLLINFWYSRIDANKSSVMAMVTNKVGDISLLIAISILFYFYKSFDFSIIFSYQIFYSSFYFLDFNLIYWICFFLVIAAVGKSAQLGLHIWLPEAMEGPTPVSSLIHAATMVTAGIFLLIRCSFLFEAVPSIYIIILFFGSLTTFLGATIGLFQYDIKKIIAYSTCSQLGYMFLACGLLGYSNSIYHLINHAFFKALLFLSAGVVIHCCSHEQDFRKMGSLIFFLPFSYVAILIGSLSLAGFPFFSGFYSKEKIIQLFFNLFFLSFDSYIILNWFFFFFFFSFISIIFTILYSIKLIFYVFFNSYNGFKIYLINFHYESFFMIIPLFLLIYFSLMSGFFSQEIFVGIGTDFWQSSLYIPLTNFEYFFYLQNITLYLNFDYFLLFNYEFYKYIRQVPLFWVFYMILLFSFIYSLFFSKLYLFNLKYSSFWIYNLYGAIVQKWIYFNKLIIYSLIDLLFFFSLFIYFFLEKGFLEKIGPFGIVKTLQFFSTKYGLMTKGLIYHYLGFILLGLFMMIHVVMI